MLLQHRSRKGKEDPARLDERMGIASRCRPEGKLAWFHAASVGEAQSTLILIDAIQKKVPDLHILVTTGTVTSATLMEKRLPSKATHQYIPLDHPVWVRKFISHWQPDVVFWLESELWPNILRTIKQAKIPATLINAHLSKTSFKRWKKSGCVIRDLLDTFSLILTQTQEDADHFIELGAIKDRVKVSDNIKYSADPLPYDENTYKDLTKAITGRPVWLYASTHEGEELIACRLHNHIKKNYPDLLTIIVPRHPERRNSILDICKKQETTARLRGNRHDLPQEGDDIYIADTLGELGLFYRLAPMACIGRSFSNDGGGGHNPIEAAQLDCAILHGPNVQNLAQIFEEMDSYGAAICVKTDKKLEDCILNLLENEDTLNAMQNKATQFALNKSKVLERVCKYLDPLLTDAGILTPQNAEQEEPKEEKECA